MLSGSEDIYMKHSLQISVSNSPQTAGIVTCRSIGLREKMLKLLLGDKRRVTILIPGDSVNEVAIRETNEEGGEEDG